MTKDYRHQKMLMLLGPPRCGKGNIGRVLHALVGDANFSGGELSSFATDSYLDGLRTKSVVFIGDAEKKVSSMIINQVIGRIKAVSGNDAVSFHRMYVGPISCTLPVRITIGANSLPNLFDDSGALGSRMMLLPFGKSYLDREDLGLGQRLTEEIAGVAAWALEGLRRLNTNGKFTRPEVSLNEIRLIQEAYSPISRFVAECCVIDPNVRCSSNDVYNTYRAWALAEGEDIIRPKAFTSSLRDNLRGARVHYGSHRFEDGATLRGFVGLGTGQPVLSGAASAFKPRLVQ
jgi:putative DNA primase/helicase